MLYHQMCYDFGMVTISIVVLYLGVRITTFSQHFIVWFYTSLPECLRWVLDMLYLRSSFLQRIFSYRLKCTAVENYDNDSVIKELARNVGLTLESHKVHTKDGYILTLHRCYFQKHLQKIQNECSNASNRPILVMHGLMQVS